MNIADKLARVKIAPEIQQVNPWHGKIKVLTLHPTHQAGTIKAFASVQVGEALVINDCKIVQQPGQQAWVALPDRQRSDGKGYAPIVKAIDDRFKQAVDRVVLDAWQHGVTGGQQ